MRKGPGAPHRPPGRCPRWGEMLGRVIDALVNPIDGKGPIHTTATMPIEREASGVVTRKSVTVPLQTGILAVDAMVPIGRGQRELIIGDRQTGKTSIAIDTILNQKGQDASAFTGNRPEELHRGQDLQQPGKGRRHGVQHHPQCLRQRARPGAVHRPLFRRGPSRSTLWPRAKDVLIVYDDLSKHAVAYRTLSLLLRRSPRPVRPTPATCSTSTPGCWSAPAAWPPSMAGGSITALPIIETQAGDVSAYIPTNVISITDGQLYLESNLFLSGWRPAGNVGLSVSRVGGAAQTEAVKKIAGSLRIDLAQFRELEVFTQFSSDLDSATKEPWTMATAWWKSSSSLLYHPMSVARQVVILYAAHPKAAGRRPVERTREFAWGLADAMEETHPDVMEAINSTGELVPPKGSRPSGSAAKPIRSR